MWFLLNKNIIDQIKLLHYTIGIKFYIVFIILNAIFSVGNRMKETYINFVYLRIIILTILNAIIKNVY